MLRIQGTTRRNGVFYCQFWSEKKLHRTSLKTDSARQAQQVMKHLYPFVDAVRSGKLNKSGFDAIAKSVLESKKTGNVSVASLEPAKKDQFMIEDIHSEILQLLQKTGPLKPEDIYSEVLQFAQNTDIEILQLIQNGDQAAMQYLVGKVLHKLVSGRTQKQFDSINSRLGYEAIAKIADGTQVIDADGMIHVFMDSDPDVANVLGDFVEQLMLDHELKKHSQQVDQQIHQTIINLLPISSFLAASDIDLNEIASAIGDFETQNNRNALASVTALYDTSNADVSELHATAPDLLPKISQHVLKQNSKTVKPLTALKSLVTGNHDQYFKILNDTKPEKPKPIIERVIHTQPIELAEKPVEILLFSKASEDFIVAYKEKYRLLGKDAKRVPKYETYRKKMIAISGDYNVLTAKKSEIVGYLTKLFDFPHLNKSNQFNTKRDSFGFAGGIKPQEWFNIVASKIPDVIDDETIETAAGDVDGILDFMQSVYASLRDQDIFESSPLTKLPKAFLEIKKAQTSRRGAYWDHEMRQIVKYLSDSDYDLKWPVLLMIYTGCRNSEVYRIRHKDIDLENLSIFIAGTKTENAIRDIPISKRLIELGFLDFIKDMKPEQYILSDCAPEFHLNCKFSETLEELNIPLLFTARSGKTFYRTLYSVRKSFSTYAKGDANRKEILLGHSIRSADRPEDSVYAVQEMMVEELEPLREIVNSLPYYGVAHNFMFVKQNDLTFANFYVTILV